MKNLLLLFFIGAFIINPDLASAQCCSAGNPAGGDGSNDGLSKNNWRVFLSYKYSFSEDFYEKTKNIGSLYDQKSYFNYTHFSLTYGLSTRISLYSELGYFLNKTKEINLGEKDIISASGLGDIGLNVRYIALNTVKPISQLVFSAGAKAPIGAFHEELNGAVIPISLQPSSGAFKYNASIFYSRKKATSKFGWNSFALFELSSTINKGFLIYHYGNYFQYALAGTYTFLPNFSLIANSKFEWRGKDKREEGLLIESTGSRVLYLNPQLVYSLPSKWSFVLMSEIPIYKNVNGSQITNQFSFQIGIKKSLSLLNNKTSE